MSNQLVITSGAKVRSLNGVITGTTGVLDSLPINGANGIPQLDSSGKILVSQLPNSVMEYQGTWNANTNTPTLTNGGAFNQGDVYLCNVAGTTDFGAGPISFVVGDQVIYSGSIWQRASGATGTVTSVAVTESGDALSITGSPITTSGTINIGFAGTSAQYVAGNGALVTFPTLITSIGLTMPSAFTVSNSPLTANGTIAVTGAGFPSQYIRGDGTLADFPTSGGGGSSVSYYLNGGTNQGTISGTTYYEMSRTADTGTGVDFAKIGDGLIVSFLTDANDPAQLNIPGGNWNYEIYASMSSNGGTPQLYAELYKYDGTTFTLISTSSNEILYDGVNLNLYSFAMTVPTTTLAITDRLAIKLYATNSGGKTTTVHTQDSHLCQIITTFSTGITALNGLTTQVQYFATGTSGTDFNISSTTATHTFNLPTASATNRGALSSADWTTFNAKQNALTLTTTGTSGAATLVGSTLNIPQYQAAGTYVTSVTGTSPIVSSGGTTPAISITQATTSTNGYLSSTDWNTFNGKQNALTNPVTGTGTSGQVTYFNGTSSVTGSNNLKFDGTNLSIGNPSSPLAQLHVYNASAAATILLQNNSTTDYSEIAVRNDSSTATSYFRQYSTAATGSDFGISRAGLALFFSNYATNFAIGTRNGGSLIFGTADTERARIDTSGNFGIGTTSPSYKLDVNGTLRVASSATFSNNVNVNGTLAINSANALYLNNTDNTTTSAILNGGASGVGNMSFYVGGSSRLSITSTGAATFSSSVQTYRLKLVDSTSSTNFTLYTGVDNVNSIGFYNETTGVYNFKIASTGAATFSNSVTAGGSIETTGAYFLNGNAYFGKASSIISGGSANDGAIMVSGSNNLLFGIALSEKMRITSAGNVGIGTSSPSQKLHVAGQVQADRTGFKFPNYSATGNWEIGSDPSVGAGLYMYLSATGYQLTLSSAGVLYTAGGGTSDKRTKENINLIENNAISFINELKPVSFNFIKDETKKTRRGFIAQDVLETSIPNLVLGNGNEDDGIYGLDYDGILALAVKAIQEQQKQIDELKSKIK